MREKFMRSGLLHSGVKEQLDKTMEQSSRHEEPGEYATGIDFGTTYSCVAVWRSQNEVKIIENDYGFRVTSSCVAFTDAGRLLVDEEQFMTNPANAILNIKRLIGRCYSDPTVEDGKSFLPFGVVRGNNNRAMVSVQYNGEEKNFAPEEVVAMVLSKMKEIIESYLNSKVTKAVICAPACFNDSQRKAIKDAGALAGLNVMQLLNEPTAAAIFYYLQKKVGAKSPDPKNLLIFYLGGGNLDVSIVKLNNCMIQVCAVVGDTNLGGQDFDNNLVCHFVKKFMKEKNLDISNKPKSLRRLRAACKAKRVLSTYVQTVVEIDASDEGNDFHSSITRAAFEKLSSSLFKRSIDCVERCLEEAKMNKDCIDDVVLMGGSTRIPKVYQILKDFFKGKELCKSMNSDEAVAYGAAVQAAILNGNCDCDKLNYTLKIQDITALSFGLGSKDGAIMNMLIPKNTPIPAKTELQITTFSDHQPRGNLKFNLSFEVDESGILNLIAKDTSTSEKIEIVTSKNNDGLTPEEIEQMVKAASRYKKEDEEQKMISAAALNSLKDMAYDMKAAATNPFQSASNKKLMEEAADRAIVWMNTIHHAEIEEINAWKRVLEIIKTQVELVLT